MKLRIRGLFGLLVFFPDFISLWMLEKIGFFKNDLFEKIDRLSLSAKERMEADGYSSYAEEKEKYNFLLNGYFFGGIDSIGDSYGCLGLRYPEFPGEKMNFHGYDMFGVFSKSGLRGEDWGWLTFDVNGEPIMLMSSGAVATDGEIYEHKLPIDKKKIRERLPKIPKELINAQPDDVKEEFNGARYFIFP